jgi:hypothetical protein
MPTITLVGPEEEFEVRKGITKCTLFQTVPAIAAPPHHLRSFVSVWIVKQSVSALAGNAGENDMFTGTS